LAEFLTPDLCVVGAGAGGLAVARAARSYGASVIVIERAVPGGGKLATGALPIRTLSVAAGHAAAVRRAPGLGVMAEEGRVNFRRVQEQVIATLEAVRPDVTAQALAAQGIEFIKGEGSFIDKKTLGAGGQKIRARRFVIATGARPMVPAIPGLEGAPYFTTDTIGDNTRKLTHLVVIGGTVAAAEIAQAYRRLGSAVTLCAGGAFLPDVDPDLAAIVERGLIEDGVDLVIEGTVSAVQGRSMGIGVTVEARERTLQLDVSHILVAGGRLPNIEGLALERAGIAIPNGQRTVPMGKDGLTTANRRIYLIGDADRRGASVQSAEWQAEVVVKNALFGTPIGDWARRVPRVVATDPEIAEVGIAEAAARAKFGIGFKVRRLPYGQSDRARAERETRGLVKVITDGKGELVGAGMAGRGAVELGALFALAIAQGLKLADLAEMAPPYPSYAELAVNLGREADAPRRLSRLNRLRAQFTRLLG
jgi:pyruvate/2-oxoglutarate dehydrogenase complex dihydrolipoamide dehydrogenase (E3) component